MLVTEQPKLLREHRVHGSFTESEQLGLEADTP